MRIKIKKAARRSGKPAKPEGKVTNSKLTKTKPRRSQKKLATINKSRR